MIIQQNRMTTLHYLLATLGQIASTLKDFGFSAEAEILERARKDVETKIARDTEKVG